MTWFQFFSFPLQYFPKMITYLYRYTLFLGFVKQYSIFQDSQFLNFESRGEPKNAIIELFFSYTPDSII